MPILTNKKINSKTTIGVWEMSEDIEDLNQDNILYPENIKNKKRKKEWTCSRLLLNRIAPDQNIIYNKYGAPILSNGRAISISHSKTLCSIIISNENASIDIEPINSKAHLLKKKFVTKKEKKLIRNKEEATLIWCAKECLFKWHQKGKLNFKEDLEVLHFSKNRIKTRLNQEILNLHYEKILDHILVYYFE